MDRGDHLGRGPADLGDQVPTFAGAIPDALRGLLYTALGRRNTGFMLLGGRPETPERPRLLAEALVATEAVGSVALVLPWHRLESPDVDQEFEDDEDETEAARSRRFPSLPVFRTFEGAYVAGHRRIAVEYDSQPHPPVPIGFVRDHAHDLCVIVCVDDIDATAAFIRATTNDGAIGNSPMHREDRRIAPWRDLENLIGVLTWVQGGGVKGPISICDAFVPGHKSLTGARYETASDAVHAGRQLQWESRALELLEAGAVTSDRLRAYLSAWGVLNSKDIETLGRPARTEDLRVWIWERLLARRQAPHPTVFSPHHH